VKYVCIPLKGILYKTRIHINMWLPGNPSSADSVPQAPVMRVRAFSRRKSSIQQSYSWSQTDVPLYV
jgi:hypothetical protein